MTLAPRRTLYPDAQDAILHVSAIEAEARCEVLIGDLGMRRVRGSVGLYGFAPCAIPTTHTLGDHVVCSHHQGYGAALPFTAEDMRSRLA